jgi:hypothetical protein
MGNGLSKNCRDCAMRLLLWPHDEAHRSTLIVARAFAGNDAAQCAQVLGMHPAPRSLASASYTVEAMSNTKTPGFSTKGGSRLHVACRPSVNEAICLDLSGYAPMGTA